MSRLGAGLLALALGVLPSSEGAEVRVAVAANFHGTLRGIANAFESASGHRVRISVGSTGRLFAQIEQGAPFDLFLAADSERPLLLERSGRAVPGTRFTYAVGRLALWSAEPGIIDPRGRRPFGPRLRRLSIANPATAPYGVAARQVLRQYGMWTSPSLRIVRGENVMQALQFALTGGADAALVALSQVVALPPDRRGRSWEVPASLHEPITQQAVLLRSGRNRPAARAFLDFLRGDAARAIIERSGYAAGER